VSYLSNLESRFATLENMMKGLVLQESPHSQTPDMCPQCHPLEHTLSTCPYFAHNLASWQKQVNMAYQRPKNDPYAPTFNPRWRNLPIFSWNSGPNMIVTSQYGGLPINPSQARPNCQGFSNGPRQLVPSPPMASNAQY